MTSRRSLAGAADEAGDEESLRKALCWHAGAVACLGNEALQGMRPAVFGPVGMAIPVGARRRRDLGRPVIGGAAPERPLLARARVCPD